MLVNILLQAVVWLEKHDKYLYKKHELDCYVRDFIAMDGKETRNTGKKATQDPTQRHNFNEFNLMSTEWRIHLSSTRIDEKSNERPEMQKVIIHTARL